MVIKLNGMCLICYIIYRMQQERSSNVLTCRLMSLASRWPDHHRTKMGIYSVLPRLHALFRIYLHAVWPPITLYLDITYRYKPEFSWTLWKIIGYILEKLHFCSFVGEYLKILDIYHDYVCLCLFCTGWKYKQYYERCLSVHHVQFCVFWVYWWNRSRLCQNGRL
jgi:hypothetical protein